jgi:uncharacterized protein (DUF302 family)
MPFAEAVATAKDALEARGFAVLAEVDMRRLLSNGASEDLPATLVLSACSPSLARRAMHADGAVGPLLVFNLVVRALDHGRVEISLPDPNCTIGTINNVSMISVASEFRDELHRLIEDLGSSPHFRHAA